VRGRWRDPARRRARAEPRPLRPGLCSGRRSLRSPRSYWYRRCRRSSRSPSWTSLRSRPSSCCHPRWFPRRSLPCAPRSRCCPQPARWCSKLRRCPLAKPSWRWSRWHCHRPDRPVRRLRSRLPILWCLRPDCPRNPERIGSNPKIDRMDSDEMRRWPSPEYCQKVRRCCWDSCGFATARVHQQAAVAHRVNSSVG
jgi:hypothetical protein